MNPLHANDVTRQQATALSEQLGTLAAASSASRPEAAFNEFNTTAPPPTRLSSILDHFRQRAQRREHAADKLRAQEFMTGQ
jgi:hypothetical protein